MKTSDGPAISRAAATRIAAIRFAPYSTGAGAGSSCTLPGKIRFQMAPTAVTTTMVHRANDRMTNGAERVRP